LSFSFLSLFLFQCKKGTLATCTQIVWTYIFELAFLHEAINGWSVAGTVLILGFMVIVGTLKLKKTAPPEPAVEAEPDEEKALLFASDRAPKINIDDIVREAVKEDSRGGYDGVPPP
jgi:hypothetical protein